MNPNRPLPAAGRIDLHCHLLPGIDDGCQTVEQSLECVRRWKQAGFVGSACTPHVGPSWYRSNTPENIHRWLRELRGHLADADLQYELWDGGEVRINEDTIEWFSYWGLPTLGPGRCVLLDYWGSTWPTYGDECCEFLLDNGYQPILAHPERMEVPDEQLEEILQRLQRLGVWLQGNLNSISGGEGPVAQRRALAWLREDRYFLLATDTHAPNSVYRRVDGITFLETEFGSELVDKLLVERPRTVLLHNLHV